MDWTRIIEACIVAIPPLIASLAAWRKTAKEAKNLNQKMDQNTALTMDTKISQKDLERSVDSKFKLTAEAATAEAAKVARNAVIVAKEYADQSARKAEEMVSTVVNTAADLKKAVNGRLDQLIQEAREKAYAEGKAEGLAEKESLKKP